MYINFNLANIIFVIIVVTLVSIFIIFPLFLNIYVYFSINEKKLYISINLYKIIKIFGGYCELIKEGIVIHLTKNKAIIIPISTIFKLKNKVKPLKDYHIIKWNSKIELGRENKVLSSISIAFIINYIYNFIEWVMLNRKPYVKIENKINIYESQNTFKLYFSCAVVLNMLMIILSIIKILVEKFIYAISNRKQQNY